VEFDSSGVIMPTGNGGAMALDIISEMDVLPTIIAEAPVFITSAQTKDYQRNHNYRNKLSHIISLI
jgi:hypothetical protein